MRPERIAKELGDWLPAGATLVVDTFHAAIWTAQMAQLTKPGQRYIRCGGSLGWAFPATLGVKAATPDKPSSDSAATRASTTTWPSWKRRRARS
jgi:acetolactate synthase-1/2/3 large subunit